VTLRNSIGHSVKKIAEDMFAQKKILIAEAQRTQSGIFSDILRALSGSAVRSLKGVLNEK
jgi:hypothetical protein